MWAVQNSIRLKKNEILTFGRQNLTLSHPNRSLFVCISPCITFLGVVPKWNGKKGSQRRFQCGFVLLLHSLALAQLFETLQSEQGTSYYLAGFLPSDTHSWSRKRLSELKLFCVLYECALVPGCCHAVLWSLWTRWVGGQHSGAAKSDWRTRGWRAVVSADRPNRKTRIRGSRMGRCGVVGERTGWTWFHLKGCPMERRLIVEAQIQNSDLVLASCTKAHRTLVLFPSSVVHIVRKDSLFWFFTCHTGGAVQGSGGYV